MNTNSLRTLPLVERPRERCLTKGVASLTFRECLALIIRSGPPGLGSLGLADSLLGLAGDGFEPGEEEAAFFTAMELSPEAHLQSVSGLGSAAQARLLAALELGRRYALHLRRRDTGPVRPSSVPTLHALDKVSHALRTESREWLGFVPWYRSGETGGFCLVERGVRTHVNVDPAELFARILALRPAGIVLFHNHPSGDLTPSEADRNLTWRVADLAGNLGIRLLGHAIVTATGERWIDVV